VPRPVASSLRRQFAWLVLILSVTGILQLVSGQVTMSRYQSEFNRIRTAELANQQVLQTLTDAETGVRGYQLTGDRRFLDPYRTGVAALPGAQLDAALAARGRTRELLADQQVAAQFWLTGFATRIADAAPGRQESAVDSSVGKALFDAVRRSNATVAEALRADQRRATAHFRRITAWAQAGIGLLSFAAVGLALLTAVRTSRLLLSPLQAMGAALRRLTDGDRTARAPALGPAEVRQLTAALNGALDATDRAEAGLRAARDYVEQVLDTLGIAVVSCDSDGVLVFRNRAARDTQAAPSPRHVDDLAGLHEGDPRHPLARALAGEIVVHQELTLHRPGRHDRAVMVDACPLTGADGTIIGAAASGYDVTALREREAELATFAGVVAHDLKAPLAAVRGYLELFADEFGPERDLDLGEVHELCRRIARNVDRMGQLIDDLLGYATARDKPLHLRTVDLGDLVAQVSTDRLAGAGPSPQIEVDPLPAIDADQVMLRQLLDNLIGNAIKYTPAGEPARIHVWATTDDAGVRLHIDDRGIGIPADQQADVFTAFHRAHAGQSYTGTGLGLAICERVVTRHHGTITARPNPAGSGTRITITLPRRQPADPDTSPFALPAFAASTS
jgi:signal transduction histidine kinase/CHASE3 domain sensor protein